MTAVGTRAIELVRRSGVDHRVHAYESLQRHGRERDARPSYGSEAAAALGVEPERVFKTLVASVDGRLVLAAIAGRHGCLVVGSPDDLRVSRTTRAAA